MLYLIHQQLQVGLDGNTNHVGAVNGLPVRKEATELSQGPETPRPIKETKVLRRHPLQDRRVGRKQDGGPGPGQQIPHSLVLEAEARAGAMDVIAGTSVVQQAEVERDTVWVTEPELHTPSSG